MSFKPTDFRPLARSGFGVQRVWRNASRDWPGPNDEVGNSTIFIRRGQLNAVIYRSLGITQNTKLTGVTRDSSGAPVGNCSLDLYLTGADMIAQQGASDSFGAFTFDNPGSGPFYIVAYKVGAPDIAGTTVNTLSAQVV